MQAQMLTSKFGGELISFKLNGEEKYIKEKIVWMKTENILAKTFTNIISSSRKAKEKSNYNRRKNL